MASVAGAFPRAALASSPPSGGVDVLQEPFSVRAYTGDSPQEMHRLSRSGAEWSGGGVEVSYAAGNISVRAPGVSLRRICLRWHGPIYQRSLILGDAWERSYGDLAWLPIQPERALPWYCLINNGARTLGFGVKTGASAFAFWQVDEEGISLWLDMRNGGSGVLLGDRRLTAASVVSHESAAGENAFSAARLLCRKMVSGTVLPATRGSHSVRTIYGSNDWYYAYGKNTAEGILRDAALVRELSPVGETQPFTIVDEGYEDRSRFPDMHRLAEDIRRQQVAPGVWVRPLQAPKKTAPSWLLPATRFGIRSERFGELAFDPTVPEGREAALNVVREAAAWGYDLIKHDFTTYDLLGTWGNEMGYSPTADGWSFHDRTKTNTEIIAELYRDIRGAAGEDRIILGCNTVGHLSAGIFDASRTGDDVSGRDWERTRRMGVNTLAMRLPQNGIFFATDPDCIPITKAVDWKLTSQWLNAVAASGSVLLISAAPDAVGKEQKQAIKAAFALCAAGHSHSEPTDWIESRTPERWTDGEYKWISSDGASPFNI